MFKCAKCGCTDQVNAEHIPRHEIEVLEQLWRSQAHNSQRRSDELLESAGRPNVALLLRGRSQGLSFAADRLRALLDKYREKDDGQKTD